MIQSEFISILMSWAVMLSPYPAPDYYPILEYKPKEFFVEHACKGNTKCDIWGWYNDNDVVYIWDALIEETHTPIINSFTVHEFVHFLQDINGTGGTSCEDINRREREAYYIQRKFIEKHGIVPSITTKLHVCDS